MKPEISLHKKIIGADVIISFPITAQAVRFKVALESLIDSWNDK